VYEPRELQKRRSLKGPSWKLVRQTTGAGEKSTDAFVDAAASTVASTVASDDGDGDGDTTMTHPSDEVSNNMLGVRLIPAGGGMMPKDAEVKVMPKTVGLTLDDLEQVRLVAPFVVPVAMGGDHRTSARENPSSFCEPSRKPDRRILARFGLSATRSLLRERSSIATVVSTPSATVLSITSFPFRPPRTNNNNNALSAQLACRVLHLPKNAGKVLAPRNAGGWHATFPAKASPARVLCPPPADGADGDGAGGGGALIEAGGAAAGATDAEAVLAAELAEAHRVRMEEQDKATQSKWGGKVDTRESGRAVLREVDDDARS
jgi:hypothetical protein